MLKKTESCRAVPADLHLVAQVQGVVGGRAILEVADVEGREGVVDEAVHGPVLTVHVEVHQARDEVGREGDHKRLARERNGQRGPQWGGGPAPPEPGQRWPWAWPVTHVGKRDPMAPARQVNK